VIARGEGQRCRACAGSGDCGDCNGTGTIQIEGGPVTCENCGGDGDCPDCDGSGTLNE